MYKIAVEGIYESQTGNGQSKYINFELKFTTSRPNTIGLDTHIQKRYIPYYLKTEKKYKENPFTKLQSYVVKSIDKVDGESPMINKDFLELTDLEIQDLAAMYDLYEVPLYGIYPIWEMRDKAALAYMKKVLKMPMSTPKEKEAVTQLEKLADGTFKLKLEKGELKVKFKESFFAKADTKTIKKVSISDFDIDEKPFNLSEASDEIPTDIEMGDLLNDIASN